MAALSVAKPIPVINTVFTDEDLETDEYSGKVSFQII